MNGLSCTIAKISSSTVTVRILLLVPAFGFDMAKLPVSLNCLSIAGKTARFECCLLGNLSR
ncbi:hypothetical protein ABEB36_013718 [Hypothenemus hampei]|uniref:Uncharacterized protein n=1 Tax=Hypothenemus hampei TaxID=57062 RepID=A0ABD1E7U0_HYPHA